MIIPTVYYGRTGAGKSTRMKRNVVEVSGCHLFVVPRRKSIVEVEADMRAMSTKANGTPRIVPFLREEGKRYDMKIAKEIAIHASAYDPAVVHCCLIMLAGELENLLESLVKSPKKTGTADQTERHIQNSNPNILVELEPRLPKDEAANSSKPASKPATAYAFPLGMILEACPDLTDYAKTGIGNWRDFLATVAVVRPMLGISPSAWEEAAETMGEGQASIVVACILQCGSRIRSAGGYLRDLTRRGKEGGFSTGPMITALLSAKRRRERSRA